MNLFDDGNNVSRSAEVLAAILDAVNQTAELTSLASDIELFVQEWGISAVHLRGVHRESGLVVIFKVGTSECENRWSSDLHRLSPGLVPRIYAVGSRLGKLQIHWLAMEAIPFGPIGNAWEGREFELLLDAGIRFYSVASKIQDRTLGETNLAEVTHWLRRSLSRGTPGPVDRLIGKVDVHWEYLLGKCPSEIVFDDFHLGNGMMMSPPPEGEAATLIDIHPKCQPWILDVAYLQVLNSGDRNRPGHRDLVSRMAAKREGAGLSSLKGDDLATSGKITLGWMAARQWQPERAEWEPDYRGAYEQFIAEAADVLSLIHI